MYWKLFVKAGLMMLMILSACSSLFAQLSDLHYLPPLKQRSGAFVNQLLYLSTPETTAFDVNVYQGTSTSPIATLTISKAIGNTYNPGNSDNNITLVTDANTGIVQSNSGLRFESANRKNFMLTGGAAQPTRPLHLRVKEELPWALHLNG